MAPVLRTKADLIIDAKFPRSQVTLYSLKGGENKMEMLKRLVKEEEGQGLVEYTLIVLLVALVFWTAIRDTNIGTELTNAWTQVITCLQTPMTCT